MDIKKEKLAIVDIGSERVKYGFATDSDEDNYNSFFPFREGLHSMNYLRNSKDHSKLNWDNIESIYKHLFRHKLKTDSKDCNMLISDAPLNSASNKKKLTEMMFEKFEVPSLFIANQAWLAIFATGRTTGLVFDSGAEFSYIVPIYDGYIFNNLMTKYKLAGNQISLYLNDLLKSKADLDMGDISIIKQTYCSISEDPLKEITDYDKDYALPDGTKVRIGKKEANAPELLFKPYLHSLDVPGIHEYMFKIVSKSNVDVRRMLYSNIILSGGNTLFPGIKERLKNELKFQIPQSVQVEIVATPDRKNLNMIGASCVGTLSSFKQSTVSKREYEEKGASRIVKKFHM